MASNHVPPDIAHIDAEIKRLAEEIEKLHFETASTGGPNVGGQAEHAISPTKLTLPKFDNLPNFVNVEIPIGFRRAPVTCPIDPSKQERVTALETQLRSLLEAENERDTETLVASIRQRQRSEREERRKIRLAEQSKEDRYRFMLDDLNKRLTDPVIERIKREVVFSGW